MNNYTFSKFLKELIVALFVVVILGVSFYKIYSFQDNKHWNSIEKENVIAVVTGYASGPKASNSAIATYVVKGEEYSLTIENGYVLGEKFRLEYNINKPSENRIFREFPVFEKNEKTNYVIGKLISYDSWFFRSDNYEFWINDKVYTEGNYHNKELKIKHPNIKEGKLYLVEYWVENPKRSIMHLDKPIKYISNWWNYKVDKDGKIIK